MFKLDQKEFIAYRVEFQNAVTNHAHEIVGETMQSDGEFNGDWDQLKDDCIDAIYEAADREAIYTSDNYKVVQFMQQWFSEEVDEAEQRVAECGFVFENLDTYMTQLAYFIWQGHIHAAVTDRIEELEQRAQEAA
jgi:hypothetical protein